MSYRRLPPFITLWNNYPTVQKPCDQPFENQCAIRLSLALVNSGFPLIGYHEPVCKHGHARGAEALANYLKKNIGKPLVSKNHEQIKEVVWQEGIVFFKDIDGFRGGIGDHIDLFYWGNTKTGNYFSRAKQTWFWSKELFWFM